MIAAMARPRCAPPLSYSTNFSLTENPISEGGLWAGTDPTATRVRTTGGLAIGTQDGSGGFDDSVAGITIPNLGNDYEIEGIVSLAGGLDASHREVELWLRWSEGAQYTPFAPYGPTSTYGYEINVAFDGAYANIGRFKNDPALISVDPSFTPANGDRFRARIVGQVITAYWNDTQFMTVTDNAVGNLTTGKPGIGFFLRDTANPSDFAFTSLAVRKL